MSHPVDLAQESSSSERTGQGRTGQGRTEPGRTEPGRTSASAADILRQHGVQVTAQRVAVLAAVSLHPHSTADHLVESARAGIGAISRQSVYDALGIFEQVGIVRRIQPVGSPAMFEDRVGDNHHHIICRTCGSLADVDCAVGTTPCLTASNSHGYLIDEAEVAYWGVCPQCQ